jgi:hypothetical protein
LYQENAVDGIVYNSVRRDGGQCICAFRPRLVTDCRISAYLQFRWNGSRIIGMAEITRITQ